MLALINLVSSVDIANLSNDDKMTMIKLQQWFSQSLISHILTT